MRFTDDEWMLMMLYSPGTRTGLIAELQKMQKSLTGRDRNLRRWTASLLAKLAEMRMQNMRHWICIRTNKREEEKDR